MAEAVAEGAGAVLFAIDADGVLPEAGWSALDAVVLLPSRTLFGYD
jgi:NAD(P)H dehydrogenase (quinone)